MKYLKPLSFAILLTFFASSCNNPKVVEKKESATGIFEDKDNSSVFEVMDPPIPIPEESGMEFNKVKVLEILPTTKYSYLRVENLESNSNYWIATMKKDFAVGEIYFYKDGLLKTNFESKEYNRIFDKVYLVNNLVSANHGNDAPVTSAPAISPGKTPAVAVPAGSTPIADIVKNPAAYANKTIQVSGECTKINPNIMNRNWIHLKDGSNTDYDFVVTSAELIPVGHQVTFSGVLAVNKDFGAGYKYEMILENCTIVR